MSTAGTSAGYRVRRINSAATFLLDADRLREFLDPPPSGRSRRALERSADVSRLAAWVAGRGEGERNRGLFWAACRLAENNIPAPDALDVLAAAASQVGLGEREITATVRSAYRTVQPRPQTSSRVQDGSVPAMDGWFGRDAAGRWAPPVRGLS